jgi:hypothetical protein
MLFMQLDHDAVLREETGRDMRRIIRSIIGNPPITPRVLFCAISAADRRPEWGPQTRCDVCCESCGVWYNARFSGCGNPRSAKSRG